MKNEPTLGLVERCIANLGKSAFLDKFAQLARTYGASQVVILSCNSDKPLCLFTRSFTERPMAELTTSRYLSGWYEEDPLLERVRQMQISQLEVCRLKDMFDEYPETYRKAFDDLCKENGVEDGILDKIAVLTVGRKIRLIINLYYSENPLPDIDDQMLSVIGRLAIQHFESLPEANDNVPVVLHGLSDRERQVCLGILSGKKAELIAAEMEVAPSTVVTYRRRAYDKLGISSRASLFEVCNA